LNNFVMNNKMKYYRAVFVFLSLSFMSSCINSKKTRLYKQSELILEITQYIPENCINYKYQMKNMELSVYAFDVCLTEIESELVYKIDLNYEFCENIQQNLIRIGDSQNYVNPSLSGFIWEIKAYYNSNNYSYLVENYYLEDVEIIFKLINSKIKKRRYRLNSLSEFKF
jgi:hypothetical protein